MSLLVSPFPGGREHHERLESELGSAQRESANVDLRDIGYGRPLVWLKRILAPAIDAVALRWTPTLFP
jgi:hypothetical protein